MGDVIVRLTVNKKSGAYDARVISHEGGASCGEDLDEDIIKDLLEAEIPEFGQLVKPEDSGKTAEAFEEKVDRQKPQKYHPYGDDEDEGGGKKQGKKVDVGGFGV